MEIQVLGEDQGLYQRSLKIREKQLGPEHPDTATSLNDLALLYQAMGDHGKAEPLFLRSLKITEKQLGPEHPDTAAQLENLAFLYASRGDLVRARPLAERATAGSETALDEILSFASEPQRLAYQREQGPYDLLAMLGSSPDLAQAILRNKGILLDSLLEDETVARSSKDPEVKNMLEELQAAGQRLLKLQIQVPNDAGQDTQRRQLEEREALERQVENLQKGLARNVASLGQVRRALRITVPEVQSALAEDTVLLEFVRYNHYLGKAKFEARYGAVLLANPSAELQGSKAGEAVWVPLGSAEAIERNLKEYAAAMRGEKRGEVSLLRTPYRQLFEPIQKRLPKGITTLVISPDAELNFVSFATLVNEQDKFLAEQYAIKYVASGRDLVFGRAGKKGSRRLAAFANPTLGEKPALAGAADINVVHLAMMTTDQRDYAGVTLAPLPNTLQEAEFLRERSSAWNMQGVMYAGAEATEAEVKAVKSPYILHLATHGFFLPDTQPTNLPAKDTRLLGQERMPVVLHNPMQRSGLAFAGAQLTLDAWKRGETPDPENDGILMAQEVGTMDLKETWLVVLSACDTGVGEARAGEGVLGLRRGFIQAGAQNLMMTLWPVSDKWTLDMMKAFYERALKTGDAPMALADVQREFLVKLRDQKGPVMAARLAGPFVLTFQGKPVK
jgi:CHAT domain-containing protein